MTSSVIMSGLLNCWGAEDALAFFERCKTGLLPGGIIVVKENICAKGFVVDKVCGSCYA